MDNHQPGILAPVPATARYLEFRALPDSDAGAALKQLADRPIDPRVVVGLGPGLVQGLGRSIDGLRPFPALTGPGVEIPSTQADLWCWIGAADRGEALHLGRDLTRILAPAFTVVRMVDGFTYGSGLDLSGYEDGTENPEGDDAHAAAIAPDGASFVAVQRWRHDLDRFQALNQATRDNIIGRRISDNEELDDAPVSAHVKRTAQESFEPEAFVVRRSMPWADAHGEGLMFVAFGKTLDAFEAQLRRMAGLDDGITDGLFRFTRPISGSYFWCPPVADGTLDLSGLGL